MVIPRLVFRFIICIALFGTYFLQAQTNHKYPTLLWKISGNGIKKPGYLYGTMHVSKKVAFHLSDQFFEALTTADIVGLETNPSEWLENMELIGEVGNSARLFAFNPYGGNFYKNVFGIRFPEKRIYKNLLGYDPDIINSLLYRHEQSRENFEENTYIDLFIFQVASKLNKKVVSLEDFKAAEIQSRLANLPDSEFEKDAKEENDYNNLYQNYSSGIKLEEEYGLGNLDAIDSLNKLMQTKNSRRFLLNARNLFFVHSIDSILKSGSSLFSGVGAAHLPGENGVIELLRAMNYNVEPVYPKETKKTTKHIEKYEKMVKPQEYVINYSADSLYSVKVPGKLTQVVDFDNLKYSICADMTNGHFYTIARLKTNGILNNYSIDKMALMMDSLFYDNVPGKIVSKKEITIDGVKGFDIVSKTRNGDMHRYNIFINHLELILFKLGAKDDFISSNDGKTFFSSIHFYEAKQGLKTFEPDSKGFKVTFTGKHSYSRNDYVGTTGLVEELSAYDEKINRFFGVKHAIYNDFYYLEEDTFELNRLSSYTLMNFDFKENQHIELTKENNLPCAYIQGNNKDGAFFYGKILIKGVHYYLVYSIVRDKINKNDAFFESFSLTDYYYKYPIKEIKDPDTYFKTMDEVSDTPLSRFNDEYAKVYKRVKDSLKGPEPKADDFDYKINTKYYYSPSSHEYVEIFYEKYNDYDYKSKEEFISGINTTLGNQLTLKVEPKFKGDRNGAFVYEMNLADTATTRIIKCKILVKGGVVYQVKATCDSIIGLNGWAKSFFDSFNVSDTTIGKDIFKPKFKELLNDLLSQDTAIQRRATFSLNNTVVFQKEYASDFVSFISGEGLPKLSTESKAQLFVNGGILKNNSIIAPYKKIYSQYSDSTYLQICILKGLAYCKTKESYQAIRDLMLLETPLVGEESIVEDVFKVMQDSLELSAYCFPELLKLASVEEYHAPVYKLLSLLVRNDLIKGPQFAKNLPDILRDASIELKRYNASLSGKSKSGIASQEIDEQEIDRIEYYLDEMTISNALDQKSKKDLYRSSRQPLLIDFANILIADYHTNASSKSFVDKMLSLKSNEMLLPLSINALKYNVKINDTIIPSYLKKETTGVYCYHELKKEGLLNKVKNPQVTDTSLVFSFLKMNYTLKSAMAYDKSMLKDSLNLFKVILAKNKYQKGKLYIYKSEKNKYGLSKWSAVFVVNNGKEGLSTEMTLVVIGGVYNEKLSDDDIVNEINDDVTNMFRGRIELEGSGLGGNYY